MADRPVVTLLLGAEGCSEQQDDTWLREATEEEIAEVLEGIHPKTQARVLNQDGTGRPYFWMTVTGDAPQWAYQAASTHLRMVRLNP